MTDQAKPAPDMRQQQLGAPMPSKHSFKPLRECKTLAEAFETHEFMERIQSSVPQHVQPNRMLRCFVSAVSKTPLLAQADLRSFVGACLTLSQVGLEPNTPLGHAYLIPFKTKAYNPRTRQRDQEKVEINIIFGYPGLLDLSYRSGQVIAVHADVVWPGDEFSFEYGTDVHLRHKPVGIMRDESARPTYAYMHASLKLGQAFEVMPYADVLRTRDRTQAYRAALAAKQAAEEKGYRVPAAWTEAPWVKHEIPMARKTAFRQASKWLPRSVELATAIALDEAQDRKRRMDFGTVLDAPTIDGQADYLSAAAEAAQAPEPEDGPTGGPDPAAAFGVRADPTPAPASPAAPAPAAPPAPPAESTAFEAWLVDEWGEIVGEFTDPVAFMRAYADRYRQTAAPEHRQAISEYNADAIQEAADLSSEAARIGDEISDLGGQQEELPSLPAVQPPVDRGKTSWSGYVRAIKAALAKPGPEPLWIERWVAGQKAVLLDCPLGQRVLAIQAIVRTLGDAGKEVPEWLATAMVSTRPAPAADPGGQPEQADGAGGADGADAGTAEPPGRPSEARRWADDLLRELGAVANSAEVAALAAKVRPLMAKLKVDDRGLFLEIDDAFAAKLAELDGSAS